MTTDFQTYAKISAAFSQGSLRLWRARATSLSLQLALLNFHVLEKDKLPSELQALRLGTVLKDVSPGDYEAYYRVTAASHLVYATALFDSFLTDTTRFLLLRDPLKLGNRSSVSWETFLNAKARISTISESVTRRVREIAFWPFLRRIEFLNKTFDSQIALSDENVQNLDRFASIRNAIVHDHALIEPVLDDKDQVSARPRKPPHLEFESKDVETAMRTYAAVARAMFIQICERVLGVASDDDYMKFRDALFPIHKDPAKEQLTSKPPLGEDLSDEQAPANNGVHPTPASGRG